MQAEWDYHYQEGLGNLCVWGDPTPAQHQIAASQADASVQRLKGNDDMVEKLRKLKASL